MTKILYTVATDKDGNLIKANDAEKGADFFCPVCRTDMILRKAAAQVRERKDYILLTVHYRQTALLK